MRRFGLERLPKDGEQGEDEAAVLKQFRNPARKGVHELEDEDSDDYDDKVRRELAQLEGDRE